jgi:hypothetical protein
MVYFAYVKNTQPWSALLVMPQIIHDEKMAEYRIEQKSLVIIERFKITEEEAQLPINELMKKYPRRQ